MMIRHVTLCAAALLLCAPEGRAETPPPFPEFSAKRVKPPKAGTTKRITVQIAPQAPAQAAPAATGAAPTPGAAGNYDWFWDAVSPDLAAGGPGRLDVALGALSSARSPVPVPRLQVMQDVARAHGRDILVSSVGTQVSPALVLAVMMVESGGDPAAVSRVGAQGLMQLMPATAEEFGVADALEPQDNIRGGVAYLNWLMKRFDGDPILVLAGYNAGPGAVRDNGGVPPFPETRDYVPKVLAAYKVARGLCMTPPQLISDGCVFAAMN